MERWRETDHAVEEMHVFVWVMKSRTLALQDFNMVIHFRIPVPSM